MAIVVARSDEPIKPKATTARVWDWRAHIPIIVAGFSVLFVGIRLLSISGGNFETADSIMQASGTATIVIGAFLPVLGWIALAPGIFIAAVLLNRSVKLSPRPPAILLMFFLLAVGILTAPISFAINVVILTIPVLAIAGFSFAISGPWKRFTLRNALVTYMCLLALISFIDIAFNPVPWVPSENITSTVQAPFTGYVLGESDVDTTILAANGQIVHIPPNKIINQIVCNEQVSYNGFDTNTLYERLTKSGQRPYYPECIEDPKSARLVVPFF